jgi:hypothetical protein
MASTNFPQFWRIVFHFAVAISALSGAVVGAEPNAELRWWKGNIHTHSLWSDGNDFPEMIGDWYKSHGYHFLALSDHNILSEGVRWMKHAEIVKRGGDEALAKYRRRFGSEWVETRGTPDTPDFEVRLQPLDRFRKLLEEPDRFLMIQGEEISDQAEGVPVHMNATNIQKLIEPFGGKTVAEAIDNNLRAVEEQAQQTGREILVHLNHPNFGWAITAEDLAAVLRERFVEVYNGHNSVNHLGDERRASVEQIWDIANTIRLAQLGAPPLFGVATDDSHNYHSQAGATSGRGWIMVHATRLEPDTLIKAIKAGDLYASSGVTLGEVRYDAENKQLHVQIQADETSTYTTQFIGTRVGYDQTSESRVDANGKPLRTTRKYSSDVGEVFATVTGTTAVYQLKGDELYVRAVITSTKPHWNPSFKDQREQAWTQPVGWQERLGQEAKRVSAN